MTTGIVIGVDGSQSSLEALRWGAAEASLRQVPATAVLVWSYTDQHEKDPAAHGFRPEYSETDARDALASWVAGALGPDHGLELAVRCDLPAQGLLDEAAAGQLLVVGARGKGGFAELLLGSTAERVAEHTDVPLAVVRGNITGRGPVVVGVDGSARAAAAMRWAADEARARQAPLFLVHAWEMPPTAYSPYLTAAPDVDALAAAAHKIMDDALAHPSLEGVQVVPRLFHGYAPRALLEEAASASVAVVGSRGLGRFGSVLLGSVSRRLLHHSPCPVVVVPA